MLAFGGARYGGVVVCDVLAFCRIILTSLFEYLEAILVCEIYVQ